MLQRLNLTVHCTLISTDLCSTLPYCDIKLSDLSKSLMINILNEKKYYDTEPGHIL